MSKDSFQRCESLTVKVRESNRKMLNKFQILSLWIRIDLNRQPSGTLNQYAIDSMAKFHFLCTQYHALNVSIAFLSLFLAPTHRNFSSLRFIETTTAIKSTCFYLNNIYKFMNIICGRWRSHFRIHTLCNSRDKNGNWMYEGRKKSATAFRFGHDLGYRINAISSN